MRLKESAAQIEAVAHKRHRLSSSSVQIGEERCGQQDATSALHEPDCSQAAQITERKQRNIVRIVSLLCSQL